MCMTVRWIAISSSTLIQKGGLLARSVRFHFFVWTFFMKLIKVNCDVLL